MNYILIDKTNNVIIGKIYDLQSKNLLSSINNISENNQNSSNANNNYPGGSKKEQKLNKLSIIMDKNWVVKQKM